MDKTNDYLMHVAESKELYHKNKSKTPYEEKVKIILELQKINLELRKRRKSNNDLITLKVWDLHL